VSAIWALDIVWTYARGAEQMWLRRAATDAGLLLVESRPGVPDRSYFFADLPALLRFQNDRIASFTEAGWCLVGFRPERRRGLERRGSRTGRDRRRSFQTRTA
jgi:hypothetical protein